MMEFYGVIHPEYQEMRRLRSTKRTGYARYYAFPAILHADQNRVLIAYKNGVNHGRDPQGTQVKLEQITLDIPSQRVTEETVVFDQTPYIPQMGEYVCMPNGDICLYVDMQRMEESVNVRTGMEEIRSKDGGKTYLPSRRLGVVDGVEYGYPLNFCEKNGRVYMLAMTFPNLAGSKGRRQVHVISSADNGASWRFEVNLTEKLSLEFNESALLATQEGFALFTRGESARHQENAGTDAEAPACLVMLDDAFHLLRMRDYRHTRNDFSQVGRPRLYRYRDILLLITRQHIHTNMGIRMALDLFAIEPRSLEIRARFRLNDPVAEEQDGHYANLYLDETGKKPMLRVVDYLTCPTPANPTVKRKTDIVQMSFDVAELIRQAKEETGCDF